MKKVLPLLMLLVTASFYGCGGSNAQTSQPDENNPPANLLLSSNFILDVNVKHDGGNLTLVSSSSRKSDTPLSPRPRLAGDFAVIVVDQEDQLQYATMITKPTIALGEGTDPETGRRFGVQIDVSDFPIYFRVPINAKTKEVFILNEHKERILVIPITTDLLGSHRSQENEHNTNKSTALDNLHNQFHGIIFRQANATLGYENALYRDDFASALTSALSLFRERSVLLGIEKLYVVTDPAGIWTTLEGLHYDNVIYLVEDFVLGDHLAELIAHEGAHAYIQLLEEIGTIPISQYGNGFANMSDIVFLYSNRWTEIKRSWYNLQREYREKRSHSICDEAYVASEYEYGENLLPASSDKNPTVDNFFKHGFVSPYASTDVGEDIAEAFTFALFRPEALSRKVRENNIFDRKLALLKELGMLTTADYDRLTSVDDEEDPGIVLLEFRHKGIVVQPLNFALNDIDISPNFYGVGEYAHEIGAPETWIQDGQNELTLATLKDADGDYDDIEVEKLRLSSLLPIDPETGCDMTIVYLDAPEPIHLGNDNCPADSYCSSYTPLQGTAYTWIF